VLDRRAAIEAQMPNLTEHGWALKGCGAYFAYLQHPFEMSSDQLCQTLVKEAGILALPGTMFMPEGHADAPRHIRIAFANIDADGIAELFERLAGLRFSLAQPRAAK